MLKDSFAYLFLHLLSVVYRIYSFSHMSTSVKALPGLISELNSASPTLPGSCAQLMAMGIVGCKWEFKNLQVLSLQYHWGKDVSFTFKLNSGCKEVYDLTCSSPRLTTGLFSARNSTYCSTDLLQTDDSQVSIFWLLFQCGFFHLLA